MTIQRRRRIKSVVFAVIAIVVTGVCATTWTLQEVAVAVLVGLPGGILGGYISFRIDTYLKTRKGRHD